MIGWSYGLSMTDELVIDAFNKALVNRGLESGGIFHSDRGSQYTSNNYEDILLTIKIQHSYSKKGYPYDNAVVEATYKIVKTEFAYNQRFESFEELERELFDYVNWYNNIRIHGSLDYQMSAQYRLQLSL